MTLNGSNLGLSRDPLFVNALIVSIAGDEIPGVRAGARSGLSVSAFVNIVNDVFSLSFPPGCLVMIRVDIVFLAHKSSIERIGRIGQTGQIGHSSYLPYILNRNLAPTPPQAANFVAFSMNVTSASVWRARATNSSAIAALRARPFPSMLSGPPV